MLLALALAGRGRGRRRGGRRRGEGGQNDRGEDAGPPRVGDQFAAGALHLRGPGEVDGVRTGAARLDLHAGHVEQFAALGVVHLRNAGGRHLFEQQRYEPRLHTLDQTGRHGPDQLGYGLARELLVCPLDEHLLVGDLRGLLAAGKADVAHLGPVRQGRLELRSAGRALLLVEHRLHVRAGGLVRRVDLVEQGL
ncbi:hypothetical protein LUR56_21605 [Streptomyces sp. MT29]|nr:hypothetical protein [Streptomyces sp. MT29]